MIRIFESILNVIYPKRCGLCGEVLEFGKETELCDSCRGKLCGKGFPLYRGGDGISLFAYEGEIRSRIIEIKFFDRRGLCSLFGSLMAEALEKTGVSVDFDEILFVPASEKSLKERGYNQAELMARQLGAHFDIPVGKGLVRIKETKQQNKLHIDERAENIRGAFSAEAALKGKKILLVDDIYTTGSTIGECRKTLLDVGCQGVFYITAAKTELKNER